MSGFPDNAGSTGHGASSSGDLKDVLIVVCCKPTWAGHMVLNASITKLNINLELRSIIEKNPMKRTLWGIFLIT